MRKRYIKNFDTEAKILLYNHDTGVYEEIERDQVADERHKGMGFYVHVAGGVVGVYSSPHGPVCFHNQRRYPLVRGSWDVTVVSEDEHDVTEGQNKFTLIHHGQEAFSISYKATPFRYYGPWTDDEDVDFFLWLKSSVESAKERERFHVFCTKEWYVQEADLSSGSKRPPDSD